MRYLDSIIASMDMNLKLSMHNPYCPSTVLEVEG